MVKLLCGLRILSIKYVRTEYRCSDLILEFEPISFCPIDTFEPTLHQKNSSLSVFESCSFAMKVPARQGKDELFCVLNFDSLLRKYVSM